MPASSLGRGAWKITRRWLYLTHRWIGIFTCLLCAVWFISGLVMMYVPYPSLTEAERAAASASIDWDQVEASPQTALAATGLDHYPDSFRLEMAGGEPVYRIADARQRWAVSARDGRRITAVSPGRAAAIATGFTKALAGPPQRIQRDQWTVAQGFDPHRPLYRVPVQDGVGTTLYLSSRTGEVVQQTTRRERAWNWVGSVPHWIYLTQIRKDPGLWHAVIVWTSGPAIIGAVSGLWIGLMRLRVRRRFAGDRMTPYRGWMKWHHVGGLVSGLFVVTWLFSGWLSMNPNQWFNRAPADPAAKARYQGQAQAVFPDLSSQFSARQGDRLARFTWAAGQPRVIALDPVDEPTPLDPATAQIAVVDIPRAQAWARALIPGQPLEFSRMLTAEDAYWYSHHNQRRLPVLRVGFTDPAGTWFHIDAVTGELLGRTDRSGRTYRWLFSALHSFDFKALLSHRPAWDVVMWTLSLGGLLICVTGVWIGWLRLIKDLRALRRRPLIADGRRRVDGLVWRHDDRAPS